MAYYECSLKFHRAKILDLLDFGEKVKIGYYKNNPPFTSPVISKAALTALLKDYLEKFAAYDTGGSAQKPDFEKAKRALIKALDSIAEDVNEVAQGKEVVILKGGFIPRKVIRTRKGLPHTPEFASLRHGNTREIIAIAKKTQDAESYTCIVCEGVSAEGKIKIEDNKLIIPKDFANVQIDESKSRKKRFLNLKQKETYYVYFFSRNAAGISNLSEGRSIICV
jgi:hypothetical protein